MKMGMAMRPRPAAKSQGLSNAKAREGKETVDRIQETVEALPMASADENAVAISSIALLTSDF